jgi:hypothetical protein
VLGESDAPATEPSDGRGRGSADATLTPGGVITRRSGSAPFEVHLDVFSGPFDLLLGLISKHKLDITEIALAKVTDEFIAHIKSHRADEQEWDLSQASEFLLVAATLLDIKAARLLPQLSPQDEEDLALIEARDLLFARLLQYRAFKDIAHTFSERMATAGRMTPRQAGLEPQFAALIGIGVDVPPLRKLTQGRLYAVEMLLEGVLLLQGTGDIAKALTDKRETAIAVLHRDIPPLGRLVDVFLHQGRFEKHLAGLNPLPGI